MYVDTPALGVPHDVRLPGLLARRGGRMTSQGWGLPAVFYRLVREDDRGRRTWRWTTHARRKKFFHRLSAASNSIGRKIYSTGNSNGSFLASCSNSIFFQRWINGIATQGGGFCFCFCSWFKAFSGDFCREKPPLRSRGIGDFAYAGTAIFFPTLMSIDGLAVELIHLLRINMNGLRFLSTLPVIDISFSPRYRYLFFPRYFPPLSSSYLSQDSSGCFRLIYMRSR